MAEFLSFLFAILVSRFLDKYPVRESHQNRLTYDALETRRVLAGNLHVLVSDSILLVVGDSANNQVEITQNDSGGFVVTGIDTTINQGNDPFVVNGGVQHLTISMQGGNDEVAVDGVTVPSNFSFYGGQGNDRLNASGVVARHFEGKGQQGDDVFELDMQIRKSAYLYLGEGNDVVSSTNLFVGRNLKIFGAAGDNTISTETLTVGRKLEISLGSGADDVLMSGTTSVSKRARVDLGAGDDLFGLIPSQNSGNANFRKSISVNAGAGNDNLAFDSSQVLHGSIKIDGGEGVDAIQRGAGLNPTKIDGIEASEISNWSVLLDEVFARLENAGIGVVEFEALSASATSTALSLTENAAATSVDSAFVIAGSERVTGATIQISEFEPGQEVLTFTDSGSITGSFNATTGLLSLTGRTTVANYQAAIRSVSYRNTSENPGAGTRQLDFTITTDDETANVSRELTILPVNDIPGVTSGNANQTIKPEDLPVVVDNTITVEDLDDPNLASATVSIASGFVAAEDALSAQDSNGITSSFNSSTGELTLTGDATVAQWQSVLRTVTYANPSSTPTEGVRTIQFSVSDGVDSGSTEVRLNLQEESIANNFSVSETTSNGTVVGQVTTTGDFDAQTIYQFAKTDISELLMLNADDHLSGDPTASVVLIEYLDFQCPNCASFHPIVQQLESDFDGELLVVRRHLPLEPIHANARAAARAAEAAARQGMFDEMADLLFLNQSEWASDQDPTSDFESYATSLGLDLNQFRLDLADADVDSRISRDAGEAADLGYQSTATFVLQGERITSPGTQALFADVIDDAISELDNPFSINVETGEIIVRDTALLDATNTPTVTLSVVVSDSSGNSETVVVTVNVTD